MAKTNKKALKEDISDDIIALDNPIIAEPDETTVLPPVDADIPPIEDMPKPDKELVENAYMNMLQDLLKKQWDVINACESLTATLSSDETIEFDKEAVKSIVNEIGDTLTMSVGMTTKAIGTIDPTQSELMKQGEEKADDAVEDDRKEPESENISEDMSTIHKLQRENRSETTWEDKFAEYVLDAIENKVYNESDAEQGTLEWKLLNLNEDELWSVCESVGESMLNCDSIWETIDYCIDDLIDDAVDDAMKDSESQYTSVQLGESEEGKSLSGTLESIEAINSKPATTRFAGATDALTKGLAECVMDEIDSWLEDGDGSNYEDYPELEYLSVEELERVCIRVADDITRGDSFWETITDMVDVLLKPAVKDITAQGGYTAEIRIGGDESKQ